ncbi:MAG TPA: porin family protein [Xanthobacteraceae bacterium]|nr:porin family protein [Xanthobacteraceae bacterium]
MKKLLASIAGLVMLPGLALAADLPVAPAYKAPPPPVAPVANWTGCYVDGGFGYGLYNETNAFSESGVLYPSTTAGGRGWVGTVGGGCDYQFPVSNLGNFVVGVLADYDFMNLTGTSELLSSIDNYTANEKENSAWAVGARIGFLVTPAILAYTNGGYTQTHFDASAIAVTPAFAGYGLTANTYHGWFLGGGTEIAVKWLPGLYVRSEYRYSTYSTNNVPWTLDGVPQSYYEQANKQVQTIMTALVYKFNWPGY